MSNFLGKDYVAFILGDYSDENATAVRSVTALHRDCFQGSTTQVWATVFLDYCTVLTKDN